MLLITMEFKKIKLFLLIEVFMGELFLQSQLGDKKNIEVVLVLFLVVLLIALLMIFLLLKK